jgi:TP901 family phage tail tape measure protein
MAQSFNLTARINLQGPFNLKPIVSKIKKDIGSINPTIKFKLDPSAAKSVAKVTSEIKKLQTATNNAQKSVGSLNTQLLSLSSSFNAAATASKNVANATTNVGRAAANSAKSVSQARTAIEEFGKQSGLAIKRFAAFSSVTTVVFGLTSALVSAYKEFIVFNREIVRLSQVTGKSVSNLKGISDEITRLSTSLGVASTDLISITSTLAQAGLSAEDTKVALEALAKSTLAPTFKDIQNTTEGAIAAIRQFGLETRELDGALGSINAVAGAFAVEADDIVAAIQRTGGVFASTSRGVSQGSDALNEFIAIFTSVRQTTRESAETIATGLRTIFTRIQRSSTIDLLKQYGVELRDLEGKFVGPFEAVKRLSEGLSGIDPRSADFAKISEELGGFRQIGKVIPLIQQFAVAQDALNVAQKGSGSLTKDVIAAQQSLAVQFTKTRENFLALIRDIGEGQSFKVFVGSTLTLTNGLISLGQALKPILPLLLTFGAIKIGSGINQFLSGFGLAFNRGGGGSGGGAAGTSVTSPSGRGGGGNQPLTAALTLNTTATNSLVQTLGLLNTTVSSLNQNIILLVNKPSSPGFASGGLVPGTGNRDTFNANLMPGEFVIRKKAVQSIGINNLANMNRGNISPSRFANGGKVEDRIQFSQDEDNRFGLVGLKSGTGDGFGLSQTKSINLGGKYGTALLDIATISQEQGEAFSSAVEEAIEQSFILSTSGIANQISKQLKVPGNPVDTGNLSSILKGSGLANVVGAALETAIALTGAEYWDKTESTKSIDFPFGLGPAAGLFGANFPGNIPTDVTKTIGGVGKGETQIAGQIKRFIDAIYGEQFTKAENVRASAAGAQNLSPILSKTLSSVKNKLGGGGANLSVGEGYQEFKRKWGSTATKINSAEAVLKQLPASQQSEYVTDWRNLVASAIRKKRTVKRADGGGISAQDTVPALLTPGEFVFNKKAAQKIGYGNLNRLNKADKIQGFNKGGVVGPQKFAIGGAVRSDPTLIGAALASVLLPEIQKLANTFNKLEGSVGDFGTALGGAIRESSSIVLSAGIGLRAVGASRATVATAQIAGGAAAAIGGGLTDTSAKLLERALLDNTAALGKFDKNLQDIASAPTEELRLEAAKRLEQSFNDLEISLRNSKEGIDNLEQLKNFGQSLNNVTLTVLSTVTAVQALSAASKNARLAQAGQTIAVSAGTRLLAKFGSAIPVIGSFIAIGSVALEVFSLWNTRLKSSSEQFDRLNKALDDTVQNSEAYNLSNKNFVLNILPKFQKLVNEARGQGRPVAEVLQQETSRLSPLDLRFRSLVIPRLQEAAIPVGSGENLEDVRDRLIKAGSGLIGAFDNIIEEASEYARIQDAISFLVKNSSLDREAAEKKVTQLLKTDASRVTLFANEYAAAKKAEFLSSRLAADSINRLQVSIANLDNVIVRASALYQKSFTDLSNGFEDLDRKINLLSGTADFDISSIATRDIQIFENLIGSSNQDVFDAISRFNTNFNIGPDIGTQIRQQVEASKVLQDTLGVALTQISEGGAGNVDEVLEKTLKPALVSILGDSAAAANTISNILKEASGNIRSAVQDGKGPKSIDELVSSASGLSSVFKSGEKSIKFVVETLGVYGKTLKALSEEQKKTLELESLIRQKTVERIEAEKKASFQFREILDIDVPLSERLGLVDRGTIEATRNVGGIGPSGTSDINQIIRQRDFARVEADRLEALSKTTILTTEQTEKLNSNRSALIRLTEVIKNVAQSGEGVNLVFEAIAKQRDQFKTDREVLFDILKRSRDPAQQAQLAIELRAVQAVLSGAFTESQAFTALESSLTRVLTPQLKELFQQRVGFGLTDLARPRTPEERGAVDRTRNFLTLGGLRADTLSTLSSILARREVAAENIQQDLTSQLNLRVKETDSVVSNLNTALSSIAPEAIRIAADLRSVFFGATPLDEAKKVGAREQIAIEKIFTTLSGLTGEAVAGRQKELPILNETALSNLKTSVSSMVAEGRNFSNILQEIRSRVLEAPSTSQSLIGQTPIFRNETQIIKELKSFFDLLNQIETEVSRPRNITPASRSVSPSFQSGASLDPASRRTLDSFNTTTKELSTALTGENNNINNLASAVNTLAPVTNDLKTAITELGKLFKDGKIQLDQQANANVNVTFENGIPLETESGLDSKIASNIQALLNTTLDQKFSSLIRTLLS